MHSIVEDANSSHSYKPSGALHLPKIESPQQTYGCDSRALFSKSLPGMATLLQRKTSLTNASRYGICSRSKVRVNDHILQYDPTVLELFGLCRGTSQQLEPFVLNVDADVSDPAP
jgi:hypothetical protein